VRNSNGSVSYASSYPAAVDSNQRITAFGGYDMITSAWNGSNAINIVDNLGRIDWDRLKNIPSDITAATGLAATGLAFTGLGAIAGISYLYWKETGNAIWQCGGALPEVSADNPAEDGSEAPAWTWFQFCDIPVTTDLRQSVGRKVIGFKDNVVVNAQKGLWAAPAAQFSTSGARNQVFVSPDTVDTNTVSTLLWDFNTNRVHLNQDGAEINMRSNLGRINVGTNFLMTACNAFTLRANSNATWNMGSNYSTVANNGSCVSVQATGCNAFLYMQGRSNVVTIGANQSALVLEQGSNATGESLSITRMDPSPIQLFADVRLPTNQGFGCGANSNLFLNGQGVRLGNALNGQYLSQWLSDGSFSTTGLITTPQILMNTQASTPFIITNINTFNPLFKISLSGEVTLANGNLVFGPDGSIKQGNRVLFDAFGNYKNQIFGTAQQGSVRAQASQQGNTSTVTQSLKDAFNRLR
jgi:hypothetical protein